MAQMPQNPGNPYQGQGYQQPPQQGYAPQPSYGPPPQQNYGPPPNQVQQGYGAPPPQQYAPQQQQGYQQGPPQGYQPQPQQAPQQAPQAQYGEGGDGMVTFAPPRTKLPIARYPFELRYKGSENKEGKKGPFTMFKYVAKVCDGQRAGAELLVFFFDNTRTEEIVACAKACGVQVQEIDTPQGRTPRLRPSDLDGKRVTAEVSDDGDYQRLGDWAPYQSTAAVTPPAGQPGPVGGWGPPR